MKALIFNSGIGKRMGKLTQNNHKSMVKLHNGETIFERQIRILSECGIKEFVVTTGLYQDCFSEISEKYPNITIHYVNNPIYDKTNYIYSFYLAKEFLDDSFIMLHGDLVFNKALVKKILNSQYESCVTIDKTKDLSEKDFKGRLIGDKLTEVSINIFDDNCFALQPFYKLSRKDMTTWINQVTDFIENRNVDNVYAENAMNEVTDKMHIHFFDASNDFIEEIDNPEDYNNVVSHIPFWDYQEQAISHSLIDLPRILANANLKKPFIVASKSVRNSINVDGVFFSGFSPNPVYEDIYKALTIFKKDHCDCLISIGGGSAIDIAKSIKMLCSSSAADQDQLPTNYTYSNLKHIAIPTTAGTGSESTHFAVIYKDGEKHSLSNPALLPDYVILDHSLLKTLPAQQRVATLFDALCQSIESLWSVNCTSQSILYAKDSIELIMQNMDEYLSDNSDSVNTKIMNAANLSGKAINITKTTAAHAMSYKLTTNYQIPHGQAVAICMPSTMKQLINNIDATRHPLGKNYLVEIFDYLRGQFNNNEPASAFNELVSKYELKISPNITAEELAKLANSVNLDRLANYPLALTNQDLCQMYKESLA